MTPPPRSTVVAEGRAAVPLAAAAHAPTTRPESEEFRALMRAWVTGVAVVTARGATRPEGCTASALLSVSLRPPLLLVSLSDDSRTLAAIRADGRFGVGLLADHQADVAELFATAPGDRFARVPHRLVDGVPVLDGTRHAAVCRVERAIAAADHTLVLGRPVWYGERGTAGPLVRVDGVVGDGAPLRRPREAPA